MCEWAASTNTGPCSVCNADVIIVCAGVAISALGSEVLYTVYGGVGGGVGYGGGWLVWPENA